MSLMVTIKHCAILMFEPTAVSIANKFPAISSGNVFLTPSNRGSSLSNTSSSPIVNPLKVSR